jgi:hypothetical protein
MEPSSLVMTLPVDNEVVTRSCPRCVVLPAVSKAPPGSCQCGVMDDGKGGEVRLSCYNDECCSQYGTRHSGSQSTAARSHWQHSHSFCSTVTGSGSASVWR